MKIQSPSAAESQREHFIALLRRFHTAMLVTSSSEAGFHARPMAIAQVEDSGRVWFLTAADSPKVREIEHDSHVTVTAQDGESCFLTLTGRAVLVDNPQKVSEIWHEPYRVWFPEGPTDPTIELISVDPDRGEFWDYSGFHRASYLWEAAKAYVTGTLPEEHNEQDRHGTVQM